MAAPGSVTLDQLTRRHGIKVVPAECCSVEDCSLAVAQVVVRAGLGQKIGPGIFWSRRPTTTLYNIYIYINDIHYHSKVFEQ